MALTEAQLLELSRLTDALQALPQAARGKWLAALGPEQAWCRPMLERLAVGRDGAGTRDFLVTLPKLTEAGAVPADGREAGTEIGPYRLLRELGRGGMGTVWLAERSDGALKREVALKLPHSALPRRQLAERFARERDILAGLAHPHIARLYNAGVTAQGQPYLALEYVQGEPLSAWCDGRRLDLRGRIGLLLQALAAVQYAHGQLVVHRDLKPSNMLVTAQGEVRLLDFGIAKLLVDGATEETELTQLGGRALTLQYASPEQVLGLPIGTASDVYALGVVLYELLTGVLPYRVKRDSRGALEDAILGADPAWPSRAAGEAALAAARGTSVARLARELKGDLDTIVLKALKKKPEERYATADALAADLRRYLAGEAVQARPDSAWYRTRKFVRRNRLTAAAVLAVVMSLATGLGIALWQARLAQQEATTAKAVQDFLEDIFQANTSNQPNPQKARQTTARELLDIGAARIDSSLAETPKAKGEVLRTLADLYSEMGLREKAIEIHRKRIEAVRRFAGGDSLEMADAMLALCTVMGRGFTAMDLEERKTLTADAERILDRHGDRRSILRARLFIQLSWLYLITDAGRAYEHAAKGVELYRAFPPTVDKVEAITSAAVCLLNLRRAADAKAQLADAIATAESAGAGASAGMPLIHVSMGIANVQLGEFAPAIASIRLAYDLSRKANGEDDVDTIYAQKWLGEALVRASEYREAIDVLKSAIDAAIRTRGADDTVILPEPLYVYGIALYRAGRIEEGFGQVSRAIELTYPRRRDQPALLEAKAAMLTDFGRFDEAEELYDKARQDRERTGTWKGDWLIDHWDARVDLLLATGRFTECLQRLAELWPPDTREGATVDPKLLWMVARAEFAAGSAQAAERHAEGALDRIQRSAQRRYRRDFEAALERFLGKVKLARGSPAEAQANLGRAATLLNQLVDPARSPKLADVEVALGRVVLAMGRRDEAAAHMQRALSIYRTHPQLGSQYLDPLGALRAALRAPAASAFIATAMRPAAAEPGRRSLSGPALD